MTCFLNIVFPSPPIGLFSRPRSYLLCYQAGTEILNVNIIGVQCSGPGRRIIPHLLSSEISVAGTSLRSVFPVPLSISFISSLEGTVRYAGQLLPSYVKVLKPVSKQKKLDRVGPVDNRPFTDKLHHFGKK